MKTFFTIIVIATSLVAHACTESEPQTPQLLGPVSQIVEQRPAAVRYPSDYSPQKSYPLVVLLHGYSANAALQDVIFGFERRVDEYQFILVLPEGTTNAQGKQFWNATDQCCDFGGQDIDDVGYVSDLIRQAKAHFNIDPQRVSLVGHSNGGYMSNRYACEPGEPITRFVNLAGLSWIDPYDCMRPEPVDVLHIHGTGDETVLYHSNLTAPATVLADGFELKVAGAEELAARWAERAGCDPRPEVSPAVADLSTVEGMETDRIEYLDCAKGSSTLLRANGVGHLWVDATDEFRQLVVEFVTQ